MLLRLTFLMFRSGRDRTQNQARREDRRKTVAPGVDKVTKRRLKSREKMRVIKKLDPREREGGVCWKRNKTEHLGNLQCQNNGCKQN